jgi:hypothetical protein
MATHWWDYSYGMMEHLGGYSLRQLAREVTPPGRHYITASELANLAHSAVVAKCGPCHYEPQRFIAKLAREGVKPERHHGRPPVYDVRQFRRVS